MRQRKLSITIPLYPRLFVVAAESVSTLFMDTYQNTSQTFTSRRSKFSGLKGKIPNFKFKPNWLKTLRVGLPILGVVVLGVVVWTTLSPRENSAASQGNQVVAPIAIDSVDINRDFSFSVIDAQGEEVTNFKYVIENAEIHKQIIVKGQRATAVQGRLFLVMNVKIVNEFDQPLSINTRDYVRVIADGKSEELLAATTHNDPVEAQAISTTVTRLALPIDEDFSQIQIQVGEIEGDKETIELDLRAR